MGLCSLPSVDWHSGHLPFPFTKEESLKEMKGPVSDMPQTLLMMRVSRGNVPYVLY